MLRIQGKIDKWEDGSLLSDLPPEFQQVMIDHGYVYDDGVSEEAPEQSPNDDLINQDILEGTISEIKASVELISDVERLSRLLELESGDKARKGAIKALQTRIEALG